MILAFTVVALLLTLTPGADTALVLRTTVRSGRRAALLCTLVWRRRMERVTGVVLLGFGVKVLTT